MRSVMRLWLFLFFVIGCSNVVALDLLKPFVLTSQTGSDLARTVDRVKGILVDAGLTVVGEYSPYADAHVVVVTNEDLKKLVAKEPDAAYLAGIRVSVTQTEKGMQVAYMNPLYFSNAYRLSTDLATLAQQLEVALGAVETFGAEGMTASQLREYHYSFGMEYFDDVLKLAEHDSHQTALDVVSASLKDQISGSQFVYRIDFPGADISVFGVGMSQGMADDKKVMGVADFNDYKQTAHLPYELVVQNGQVRALAPRFRIAVDFPDLRMTGEHGFTRLMATPDAIRKTLTEVAGGEWIDPTWQAMGDN